MERWNSVFVWHFFHFHCLESQSKKVMVMQPVLATCSLRHIFDRFCHYYLHWVKALFQIFFIRRFYDFYLDYLKIENKDLKHEWAKFGPYKMYLLQLLSYLWAWFSIHFLYVVECIFNTFCPYFIEFFKSTICNATDSLQYLQNHAAKVTLVCIARFAVHIL